VVTVVRRRLAAIVALVAAPVTVIVAVGTVLQDLLRGLVVLGCVVVAVLVGLYALTRRGVIRIVGAAVAALAVTWAGVQLVTGHLIEFFLVVIGTLLTLAAAETAFRLHVPLLSAAAPRHPVLLINPRSGDGKAGRVHLADEARGRGIEPIELRPGDDLATLVRQAVTHGADGVAMAGGDGSQAIVASIAAEHDLPYACIPAGTRNHFALDLGVDRDDVVGSLDAFVDGGEHRVDLGEVNGRVFVNNVSLGLYAEAVQRPGYRGAKLRTLLDAVPDVLGPDGEGLDLYWTGPHGRDHLAGAAILISNNRYRLGRAVGSGTRPRIDDGLLGITVVGEPSGNGGWRSPQRPWREWSTPDFEVGSGRPVPAGVDGESTVLQPPVRFRIRPRVLRARIARKHPGASPSAMEPDGVRDSAKVLLSIAAGKDPSRHG
jgi:diacylglycerol kinase-like protein